MIKKSGRLFALLLTIVMVLSSNGFPVNAQSDEAADPEIETSQLQDPTPEEGAEPDAFMEEEDAEPTGNADDPHPDEGEIPGELASSTNTEIEGLEEEGKTGETEDLDPEDQIPQEEEAEILLPVTLSKTLQGITITVEAQAGVLPHDTQLKVEAVSLAGTVAQDVLDSRFSQYHVFDITLFNDEGEVQPQGFVEVSFSNLSFQGDLEVLHIEDVMVERAGGNRAAAEDVSDRMESLTFEASEGEVSFATDHFTIYAVGEGGPFTATYKFYAGEVLIDTQIVKNGEKLLAPPIPEIQGQDRFLGWKVEGDQNYLNFDDSIQVTENESRVVRAVFDSNLVSVK